DAGERHVLLGVPPQYRKARARPEERGREGDAARAAPAASSAVPRAGAGGAQGRRRAAAAEAQSAAIGAGAGPERQLRGLTTAGRRRGFAGYAFDCAGESILTA